MTDRTAALVSLVLAKYKKKLVSDKGNPVYLYTDRQISKRHNEKAKRYEALSKKISGLRAKVKRDLKSSDPDKCLTALAVALMDHTYERVGNEESAKDGHFGVTGWKKKHVAFKGNKAVIKYVGKSGVKHEKEVTDAAIKKALRDAYEAVDDDGDDLFSYDGGKVSAETVNAYLEEFGVTAKDIRGFHANAEMQGQLRKVRESGGSLPEDKKELKAQLKEEFKEALEATAEIVGHEPATLKNQYLVPGLEDTYLKDGTVMDRMKA
jgi:DNA topoisomerase-1